VGCVAWDNSDSVRAHRKHTRTAGLPGRQTEAVVVVDENRLGQGCDLAEWDGWLGLGLRLAGGLCRQAEKNHSQGAAAPGQASRMLQTSRMRETMESNMYK
jgi:hypothetical protein